MAKTKYWCEYYAKIKSKKQFWENVFLNYAVFGKTMEMWESIEILGSNYLTTYTYKYSKKSY